MKLCVITSVFRANPQIAIACKDHRDLGGAQYSRRERYSRGGQTWNKSSKSGPKKRSQLSWSDNSNRMQNHESQYSLTLPLQYATTLAPSWELDPDLLVHELAWGQTLICAQLLAMQRQQVNNTQVQYWLFLLPLRLVSRPLAWCCSHNVRISLKVVPQTKKIGKVAGCGTKEKSFQLKLRRMATENSITRFHGVSIVRSSDFNAGPRKISRRFLYFTN